MGSQLEWLFFFLFFAITLTRLTWVLNSTCCSLTCYFRDCPLLINKNVRQGCLKMVVETYQLVACLRCRYVCMYRCLNVFIIYSYLLVRCLDELLSNCGVRCYTIGQYSFKDSPFVAGYMLKSSGLQNYQWPLSTNNYIPIRIPMSNY